MEEKSNVIKLRIKGKVPGSHGRAGRANPELGDRKTADALSRIRKRAMEIDRSKYAEPDQALNLTPEEEDFCRYATSGYSLAAAWRMAYGEDKNPDAEHRGAQMTKRPQIALRINELLEERRGSAIDEAELTRRFIAARLMEEAETAREGATRIKALELLGKQPHVAAFEDRQRTLGINEKSSAHEIETALTQRLKALGVVQKD